MYIISLETIVNTSNNKLWKEIYLANNFDTT